jgi:hypothetical protein
MTTTKLVTDTRAVADAMGYCGTNYAGNIAVLDYLADVGPTTIMACHDRLFALGADHPDMPDLAVSCDGARKFQGNLGPLAEIAANAPAVAAYADELESLEP